MLFSETNHDSNVLTIVFDNTLITQTCEFIVINYRITRWNPIEPIGQNFHLRMLLFFFISKDRVDERLREYGSRCDVEIERQWDWESEIQNVTMTEIQRYDRAKNTIYCNLPFGIFFVLHLEFCGKTSQKYPFSIKTF